MLEAHHECTIGEGEACLLELGGAEVDLVGGVLLLQHLLEGVVGRVRLAVQVTLIKVQMKSETDLPFVKSVVYQAKVNLAATALPRHDKSAPRTQRTLLCLPLQPSTDTTSSSAKPAGTIRTMRFSDLYSNIPYVSPTAFYLCIYCMTML